jgi:Tfp pilus assembly protein PilO
VPLAILAVANVAALLLIVYPLSRRVAATEERAQGVGVQLARATQEFRAARATLEGRERTDKQLERFYAEVLPRDQTAARRITYLKLAQLARDADLLYDRRRFDTEAPDRESALARMNISVPLHGEYGDMRRFIHTLETAPEFIVISEVALAKSDDEKSSSLTLTLNLTTFYRAEESPDRDRNERQR